MAAKLKKRLEAGFIFKMMLPDLPPASERQAATATGFAAAAAGAVGYSLHCPIDSPTFVVVAYGLPMTWVTLASRLLITRLLRW